MGVQKGHIESRIFSFFFFCQKLKKETRLGCEEGWHAAMKNNLDE